MVFWPPLKFLTDSQQTAHIISCFTALDQRPHQHDLLSVHTCANETHGNSESVHQHTNLLEHMCRRSRPDPSRYLTPCGSVLHMCSWLRTRGTIPEIGWLKPRADKHNTRVPRRVGGTNGEERQHAYDQLEALCRNLCFEVPRHVSHQPFHPSLNSASLTTFKHASTRSVRSARKPSHWKSMDTRRCST